MFVCYREKAKELWDWIRQLEAEKYELQYKHSKQKYEVRHRTEVLLLSSEMCVADMDLEQTDSRTEAKP